MALSAAGGFLDAFTWLAHGAVFANAQSGNVVLLGLSAALGQWTQALRHIPPIVAFMLGVFVAHKLRVHGLRHDWGRVALFSLAVEIVLLIIVALLPEHFPDLPIVLGIAFVAALQSSSFARVEGTGYSSVMTTGNLRRAAESVFDATSVPRDPKSLRQAAVFGTVCTAFLLGTAAGAFATVRLANAALVVPILLLVIALVLCRRTA